MDCPVIPFASSEIKYLQSFATSSGLTNRLCGIVSTISSLENSLSSIDAMPSSVSTHPGLIVFTVISIALIGVMDFVFKNLFELVFGLK